MKCAACGADNDPANRFCEQCGAKLDQATNVAPVAVEAAPSCPSCGAPVLPGEAFCDNCGSSLAAIAPVAVAEAAAVAVPAPAEEPPAVVTIAPAADPPAVEAPATIVPAALEVAPTPEPTPSPVAPSDETVMAVLPAEAPAIPAEPAAVAAPADNAAQAAYEAQKQALEAEIARQQPIIAQLEGVVATLGAATPAAVQASLDEARAALAKAEADFMALQPPAPPAPPVDPAVVAALEAEVARQQPVVTQLEGVVATLGAATPPAVQASLDEARAALTKARDELVALGVVAATPAVEPNAPTMLAPVGAAEAAAAVPVPVAPAPVAPPPPPPPPSGPRLVLEESGKELFFPVGKSEVVVGREDPISGIYPELDMTPYGGETGGVSRQHAKIILHGSQWSLVDLNSTNHTKVDGVRLEPNTPVPIQDGQRVQFGRLVLVFRA